MSTSTTPNFGRKSFIIMFSNENWCSDALWARRSFVLITHTLCQRSQQKKNKNTSLWGCLCKDVMFEEWHECGIDSQWSSLWDSQWQTFQKTKKLGRIEQKKKVKLYFYLDNSQLVSGTIEQTTLLTHKVDFVFLLHGEIKKSVFAGEWQNQV